MIAGGKTVLGRRAIYRHVKVKTQGMEVRLRLIVGLVLLVAAFAVLARLLPASYAVPLYVLFLVITVAFTWHERRRIGLRREELSRALQKERLAWGKEQARLQNGPSEEEE